MLAVRQCPTWRVMSGRERCFARQGFASMRSPVSACKRHWTMRQVLQADRQTDRQADELTTCAHRPWSSKLRRMDGLQVVVHLLAWEP
jgi:hypothetical protein